MVVTATHIRDLVAHPIAAVVRVASVQKNLNVASGKTVIGREMRALPLVLPGPGVTRRRR